MKYKGHQSFFIRKGWIGKGLKAIYDDSQIFMPKNSQKAMDKLGLGSNQVVALRYWLTALGLIEKAGNAKEHSKTELFELIFRNDTYIEEVGTLWALHYNLASNKKEATSWYWFFNELNARVFDKQELLSSLQNFDSLLCVEKGKIRNSNTAISSLESDLDCIFHTYIPHSKLSGKLVSPENVIDCPLGELGVVDIESKNNRTYRKRVISNEAIPDLLVLYGILGYLMQTNSDQFVNSEIKISSLLNDQYSPGRIYCLDNTSLLNSLYSLENEGYLSINRTAGSDVVRLKTEVTTQNGCLEKYYSILN